MIIQGRDHFDNQMISTFIACPTQYFYRHELGLTRVSEDGQGSAALDFGIAFHLGVEKWRCGETATRARELAADYYRDREPVTETKRTLTKLDELLELYFQKWHGDHRQPIPGWIERGFSLPLDPDGRDFGLPSVDYCGRVDVALRDMHDQELISDIKTSSAPHQFCPNPNAQFTGYIWAGHQLFNNFIGLMVDLVGVFKGKPARLSNGSWAAGKSPADVFFRYNITREPWELEEWRRDIATRVGQINECRARGYWPKNTRGCLDWGRQCDYAPLCAVPPAVREEMANSSMYDIDPWYPDPDMKKANEALKQ